MKRSDLAMIILIAALSIIVAYAVVGSLPGLRLSSDNAVEVDTIERYESSIEDPDSKIFNAQAINPTVTITIGGDSPDEEEAEKHGFTDRRTPGQAYSASR